MVKPALSEPLPAPDRHAEIDVDTDVSTEPKPQRRIQSIDVGMRVLQALTEQRRPLPLKELANLADMPPGKAHPYLVSFMAAGMVKQSPLTGHYELGPAALQMGLAALQQLDPLTEATQEAALLATRADLSVAVVVWGHLGPTVVRLDEPRYNMLAYPWATQYQQSNQWAIETLAMAALGSFKSPPTPTSGSSPDRGESIIV